MVKATFFQCSDIPKQIYITLVPILRSRIFKGLLCIHRISLVLYSQRPVGSPSEPVSNCLSRTADSFTVVHICVSSNLDLTEVCLLEMMR